MSTRGWYEYHVLDEQNTSRTLAMQFFKWGDATPGNALAEWNFFQKKMQRNAGRLPVEWLDDMLREQLNEIYESLPPHFSLAAFLFMLQRAEEERMPLGRTNYDHLPIEQRPDYQLGFALGKAMVLNGFEPPSYDDSLIDDVIQFTAVGRFIRPWKDFGLTWSILRWLQYLTQVTTTVEMGSIAGSLNVQRMDVNFIYRFFIWINPSDALKVDRLAIELCDSYGKNLFDIEKHQGEIEKLKKLIEEHGVDMYSLAQAEKNFTLTEDRFWNPNC